MLSVFSDKVARVPTIVIFRGKSKPFENKKIKYDS